MLTVRHYWEITLCLASASGAPYLESMKNRPGPKSYTRAELVRLRLAIEGIVDAHKSNGGVAAVAEILGCTTMTLWRIRTKRTGASKGTARRLAAALSVPLPALLSGAVKLATGREARS